MDEYHDYVEHPRFGRGPRFTEVMPKRSHLHWRAKPDVRIDGTAVEADLSKQTPATVQVTHYLDLKRVCRECGGKFIFFAEEQKHWYEVLGFKLDADCVRCYPCRIAKRGGRKQLIRYNKLIEKAEPSQEELLELAELSLILIREGVFKRHPGTISRIRGWLNQLDSGRLSERRAAVTVELDRIEARSRPNRKQI